MELLNNNSDGNISQDTDSFVQTSVQDNSINEKFKWYEWLLVLLPASVIAIGGALGGLVGGLGIMINMKLWKKPYAFWVKVLLVLGITLTCFLVYFVLGLLFMLLIKG